MLKEEMPEQAGQILEGAGQPETANLLQSHMAYGHAARIKSTPRLFLSGRAIPNFRYRNDLQALLELFLYMEKEEADAG